MNLKEQYESEYQPYGANWEASMKKLPKIVLVGFLKAAMQKLQYSQTPQPQEVKPDSFWNDNQVMTFVNWFLQLHKLDSRYELENQFIIDSFKAGDAAEKWYTPEPQEVKPGISDEDITALFEAHIGAARVYKMLQPALFANCLTFGKAIAKAATK